MQNIDLFGHKFDVEIVVDAPKTSFKSKAEQKKYRRGVYCKLLDPKGKTVAQGVALCGYGDTFNESYGTKVAFQRAIDRAAEGIIKGTKTRLTNDLFGPF